MTDEELRKLARSTTEKVYRGYGEKNVELMEDEFRLVIAALLEDHYIIPKSIIKDNYAEIREGMAEYEAEELTGDFAYGRLFGIKEVLESHFSKEDLIGKETKK